LPSDSTTLPTTTTLVSSIARARQAVELLDRERAEFGPGYHDYGPLFCWEDGRQERQDRLEGSE